MRLTILCLAAAMVGLAHAGDNWPQFRGPSGDGHSDSTGLPLEWSEKSNIKWKTAIHGRGWSSPVVWGDQIWMGTATEDGKKMSAVCVNREMGEIVHDLLLFENEEPRFCHKTNSYASPTFVLEEGRVYVHFGSYGTACLNSKTGEVLWSRRDLPCDHWRGPGSSPIVFGDLLIIHYDGFDFQYIVALDKTSGETVWKKDRDIEYNTDNGDFKKAYCTPIVIEVDGKKQLISPAAKATIAYDPANGDLLWKLRYQQHSATARPLFDGERLFINTGFSKAELFAVKPTGAGDITDSHVVWHARKSIGSKPSSLLSDGLIYVVHDGGVVSCLDAKSGEAIWTDRLDGTYSASPVYADDRIYIFDEAGLATVLKPGRKFEVLAQNELDAGCMASPAVSGKSLIVRTRTHLYRIEK